MKKVMLLVAVPVTVTLPDNATQAHVTLIEDNLRRAIGGGLLTGDDAQVEVLSYDLSVQVISEEPVDESLPAVPGFVHIVGDTGVPLYELTINACLSNATADTLKDLMEGDASAAKDALREMARHDTELAAWLKEPEQQADVLSLAIDDDRLLEWLRTHRGWTE